MAQYGPQEWFYATGDLATNQRAAVFGPGDQNTFASIFSDAGLTVPLPNPTTTDGSGNLEFFAADGEYWIFVGPVGTGDSILVNLGAPGGFVVSVDGVFPDGAGNVDLGALTQSMADAKGDLLVATAPDTIVRLPVGADTFVLTADSGAADGVSWQASGGGGGGIPASIIDAKGDLIAGSAPDTPIRLAVGTNGQALRANSTQPSGLEWDTLTASDVGADPAGSAAAAQAAAQASSQQLAVINAKGDLFAGTANDTTTRKGVGANGTVLTADSTDPTGLAWQVPASAPVTSVNGQVGVVVLTAGNVGADPAGSAAAAAAASQPLATINAKGDLYAGTADNLTTRQGVGTDGQVLTADSAQTTGMKWATPAADAVTSVNGQTGAVVLTAANVGAIATSLVDAKGDIIAATADDTPARVAVGTDGKVLTADSAASAGVSWQTPASAPVTSVNGQTGVVVLTAASVGAQPIATIDAKGDLYAGTGADATTRLPVGTDGQYLRAASGQTAGLEYHTVIPSDIGAVPTSRQVLTSNGLTGGGDLSADRTIQPTYGTAANTVAQGNDARIDGAQQRSTLTAKGDLYVATASGVTTRRAVGTDGQVLTADSGQTDGVKWAAATDAGAIPKSLVDAKGDLIVATANDTPARLAVGTDTFVLTADSAQASGVKWAAAPVDAGAQQRSTLTTKGDLYVATASGVTTRQGVGTDGYSMVADSTLTNGLKWAVRSSVGVFPRSTGYVPVGGAITTRSSKTSTANTMFLAPFYVLIGATLTSIAFEVTANIATAVVRLGLYQADATTMLPSGAAFADYGTTAADTTGTKTAAVSTALTPGLWYLAAVGQTAGPTLRFCAGLSPFVASATFPAGSGVGWNNGFAQTGVSGALPTIGTIADSDVPLLGVKF